MTYLATEATVPSNFVVEKIPQAEKDAFDFSKHRLYTPLGGARWPTDEWTADKVRKVALVGGGTNGNYAADEGIPTTYWYTFLFEGQSVGVIYKTGADLFDEKDPKTGAQHYIHKLVDTHLYFPASLYGRKDEVIALLEEAFYIKLDGPILPWLRGVQLELTQARLDTEYWNAQHGV